MSLKRATNTNAPLKATQASLGPQEPPSIGTSPTSVPCNPAWRSRSYVAIGLAIVFFLTAVGLGIAIAVLANRWSKSKSSDSKQEDGDTGSGGQSPLPAGGPPGSGPRPPATGPTGPGTGPAPKPAQHIPPPCPLQKEYGNGAAAQSRKGPIAGQVGYLSCGGYCGIFTYPAQNPRLPTTQFISAAWYNANNTTVPANIMTQQLDFVYLASFNPSLSHANCSSTFSLRNPATISNIASQIATLRANKTINPKFALISIGGSSFGDWTDYARENDCAWDFPNPSAAGSPDCFHLTNMYYNGSTPCGSSGFYNSAGSGNYCCCFWGTKWSGPSGAPPTGQSDGSPPITTAVDVKQGMCKDYYQPICDQRYAYDGQLCNQRSSGAQDTATGFQMTKDYCTETSTIWSYPHVCECQFGMTYDPSLRICCPTATAGTGGGGSVAGEPKQLAGAICASYARTVLGCDRSGGVVWDPWTRQCCLPSEMTALGVCPLQVSSGVSCAYNDLTLVESLAFILADTGADGFDLDFESPGIDGKLSWGLVNACKSLKQYCFMNGGKTVKSVYPGSSSEAIIPKYPILNITIITGPAGILAQYPLYWSMVNDPLCPFDYCVPMTYSIPQYPLAPGSDTNNPFQYQDDLSTGSKLISPLCVGPNQPPGASSTDFYWNVLLSDFVRCYMNTGSGNPPRSSTQLLPAFINPMPSTTGFGDTDMDFFLNGVLQSQLSSHASLLADVPGTPPRIAGAAFFYYVDDNSYDRAQMEKNIFRLNQFKQAYPLS